jgi:transposase
VEEDGLLFVGDDWSEEHHDVEVQDETGRRLGRARLAEGIAGIARLHELIAQQLGEDAGPEQVVVGIETDRGPWVAALIAAGYQVYAINPLQVARYRERHSVSGAKSDTADAHTLADMVRTDRHQLRPVAGDTDQAEAIKVVARAHQQLIWERTRHVLRLRSTLREFSPPPSSPSVRTWPAPMRWSCSLRHRTRPPRRGYRPSRSARRCNGPGAVRSRTRLR